MVVMVVIKNCHYHRASFKAANKKKVNIIIIIIMAGYKDFIIIKKVAANFSKDWECCIIIAKEWPQKKENSKIILMKILT